MAYSNPESVHVMCRESDCGAQYDQRLPESCRWSTALYMERLPKVCGVCGSRQITVSQEGK